MVCRHILLCFVNVNLFNVVVQVSNGATLINGVISLCFTFITERTEMKGENSGIWKSWFFCENCIQELNLGDISYSWYTWKFEYVLALNCNVTLNMFPRVKWRALFINIVIFSKTAEKILTKFSMRHLYDEGIQVLLFHALPVIQQLWSGGAQRGNISQFSIIFFSQPRNNGASPI